MAGTRSSARLNSSPQSEKSSSGTKRKAEDVDPPSTGKGKRGRPSKQQKTLEETLAATDDKSEDAEVNVSDAEMKDAGDEGKVEAEAEKPETKSKGRHPVCIVVESLLMDRRT